jgi:hypothetical protein
MDHMVHGAGVGVQGAGDSRTAQSNSWVVGGLLI